MTVDRDLTLTSYISVETPKGRSFGGSQNWFPLNGRSRDRRLNLRGCGLVAACDLMLYLCREAGFPEDALPVKKPVTRGPLTEEAYLDFLRKIGARFFIMPGLGSVSWQMPPFVNAFMRRAGSRERLRYLWRFTAKSRLPLIRASLLRKRPLVLFLGPSLRLLRKHRRGVTFYRLRDEKMIPAVTAMNRHFVVVTGIRNPVRADEPLYLEISSWGEKFYLDYEELSRFIVRHSTPLFSGFLHFA